MDDAAAKFPPTRLKWGQRTITHSTPMISRWPRPSMTRSVLVKATELMEDSTQNLPKVRTKSVRRDAQTGDLSKGEFETTAAFEARRFDTKQKAEQAADAAYAAELVAYESEMKQLQNATQITNTNAKNQEFAQAKLKEAWEILSPELLGNPVLTDVQYNADKGEFEATLIAERGGWSQKISAPVPIADAPRVKQDLLSGKIAPEVSLLFPTMAVEWVLVENAAQRAKRFDDAKNSVSQLEALIAEFPTSKDAAEARSRVFVLVKTPRDLVTLIDKYPTWNETNEAKRRLPQLQKQAYQSAVQTGSSSAYREFLDGFAGADPGNLRSVGQKALAAAIAREERERRESEERWVRDRPRREAEEARREAAQSNRAICEAQKRTCYSGCPTYRSRPNDNIKCESQCDAISCN